MVKIQFFGAAQEVTGALYHSRTGNNQFLIDCGLFQGRKFAERRNYKKFPFDASKIDFVLITHAHIDHVGRLPKLIREGFKGKVYTTKGTRDLMRLMLDNSQGLLQREARVLKLKPIYSRADVGKTFNFFEVYEYGKKFKPAENVTVRFQDAGHILGSSVIELWLAGEKRRVKSKSKEIKIVFTGDLGNYPTPLLRAPVIIKEADYLIIESAYGDRVHEFVKKRKDLLEDVIEETIVRNGVLMIPTFAVERTQVLLSELNELVENGRIPRIPVFLDSPLAIKATAVYRKNRQYFNKKTTRLIYSGDEIFRFPGLKFTLTADESKAINKVNPPKIIIAGSGNSEGGRILHHELRYLSDPASTILIVGYQVAGSLGRRLLEGVKTVKIFGRRVPVRARVAHIGSYSGHADRNHLLKFVKPMRSSLKRVFVVQGEKKSAKSFAKLVEDSFAISTIVPVLGMEFALE